MVSKKETNRKAYAKGEYLPEKLALSLQKLFLSNSKYEYRSKNNFLQCVWIIFYHQVTKGNGLSLYVPLGRNYWKKIYGGNYHDSVLAPLLESNIIESIDTGYRNIPDNTKLTTFGKQDGSVGVRYRITPDLLGDEQVFIPYIADGKVLTALERMLFDNKEFVIPEIPDLNFRISIDTDKAYKWVENNAERICAEFLKKDYVNILPDGLYLECHEYLDSGSYNVRYYTVKWAKFIAESKKQDFFYFNDSFYIASIDTFLQQRIPALIYHYKHQISQLGTLPIEEKQSPVTLRIYSHLTNFPSRILQFININNKTVHQLDLRTSQFLIFANLLNVYIVNGGEHLLSLFEEGKNKKYLKRLIKVLQAHQHQLPSVGVDINDINSGENSSSDVLKFIRDVFFRDFYDVVAHELGMKERLLAKHALFKLLFKKTNRPDALLHKLSQLYPIVISIIAEFKKKDAKKKDEEKEDDNSESNLSVFLQCTEAEIFVNNILKRLRDEGIPCFTRHDSIVVADGHQDKAEVIAKEVFRKFGFKYNHKAEDKFWEAVEFEELEGSTYMQWVIDENLLSDNYDVEGAFDEPHYEMIDMDEFESKICKRLLDIGIHEDYYDLVNAVFLEDISNLPMLYREERDALYDEVVNLNSGFTFLQGKTNVLLRNLVERISTMNFNGRD
ncbi:MAG: hypothetical protein BWX96_00614 [Bacteroidetes bacterium ADurb.Bin145]|jgi:hypothetical protein|nr:MAG: hypothetical protein BWX96_00614 [Bacteroidetes bacterium ADurb.Bin145]